MLNAEFVSCLSPLEITREKTQKDGDGALKQDKERIQ